ncbi:DNA polymerase subunit beta [Oryzibacter oryziterrae]|uniref:DNA polymerase subunit beta n=1 Tax=Oryzibacter oryziterrae TaxID=2766474 RepID=UPI001F21C624|nr:DNA polymerase subunit beta [Oryzibacter oryziterrae]
MEAARRDHRADSDADLAVFLSGDAGPLVKTKLAMADIAYDILLENGVLIQPWPIWESEWQRPDGYPNPALLASIRRDGVPM